MSTQDVVIAVREKSLPIEVAEKYLKLYVADIDWKIHISTLWKNTSNKLRDVDLAKEHMKKAIACSILLPFLEKTAIPDPASNLLFWSQSWRQFNEQDWFDLLLDIMKEDIKISESRKKIIDIGIIDPIDVSPVTRQAFNWLYDKFESDSSYYNSLDSKSITEIKSKLMNLVRAYGGAIICNLFLNHKLNIDKVFNWRSGYFFEKQIHKVYSTEQIIKIKSAELSKTNIKYIKKIGAHND